MNMNATILGQAISFILFVFFCMKYIWPPIMAAIEKRQKEIAEGLSLAEQSKKSLEIAQANAADLLGKAKADAQVIIDQANKLKASIVKDAQLEAEREREKIIAQGYAEVEAESKRAREELRKQVAILALTGAEKIIERSVDEATNSDIVDKLVAEL